MKKLTTLFKKTALMGFIIVAITSCSNAQKGDFTNINATQVQELLKAEKAIIIDVRTAGEVAQGYIEGTTIFIDVQSSDFQSKINALDKTKSYVVYCRSGGRSASASNIMTQNGFTKVYNLEGGIGRWNGNIIKP